MTPRVRSSRVRPCECRDLGRDTDLKGFALNSGLPSAEGPGQRSDGEHNGNSHTVSFP